VPGGLDPEFAGQLAHQRQHPLPLGEDDDLAVRLGEQILQDPLQLLQLRRDAAGRIEDRRRVADHAHAGEVALQPLELFLGQRSAFGELGDPARLGLVFAVAELLLRGHGHEEGLHRAAGQLGLDLGLAPAQQHRLDPAAQVAQISVIDRSSALVEAVEIAVEAEQRADQFRVQILNDGIEFVDAVLQRRAGEDEGVGRAQRLDLARGLGVPVLDPLRLVEDHDFGGQHLVDGFGVAEHLLVVDDGEERRLAIGGEPGRPRPEHRSRRALGEAGDLLFPLGLQRGRAHHQHARDVSAAGEEFTGGDGLDGLAQSHLVGEQGAFAKGEVRHAGPLIGQQRVAQHVEAGGIALGFGQELGPLGRAGPGAPRALQPGAEVARDAQGRANRRGCAGKPLDHRPDVSRLGAQPALVIEVGREPAADGVRALALGARPGEFRSRFAVAAQVKLHPLGPAGGGLAQRAHAAAAQARQHALHVLAGSQAIDPVVGAAAAVRDSLEVANLHFIGAAALRAHAKEAEDRVLGLQRLDGDNLGATAPAPQLELLLVAGVPPLSRGRALEDGSRPAAAGRPFPDPRRARRRRAFASRICLHGERLALAAEASTGAARRRAMSHLAARGALQAASRAAPLTRLGHLVDRLVCVGGAEDAALRVWTIQRSTITHGRSGGSPTSMRRASPRSERRSQSADVPPRPR